MNLINFKKINIKRKITLVIVVFLLASALIVYLIIINTINNIKQLRVNIITQEVGLEKEMAREKNINILSEKLDKIEPQMKKFEQIFINQNRELEFITTLEDIALSNKVLQKISLNLNAAKAEQTYKKIPLALNIQGNFYNILQYLTSLENLNYYINITSLEIIWQFRLIPIGNKV
jgi:Tfp pilus assembly protein PilO